MALTAAQVDVKFNAHGADKVVGDARKVDGAIDNVNGRGQGFLKGVIQGATSFMGGELMTRGVSQLSSLGMSFLTANADAETLRMQLEVATGSADKAGVVYDNLMKMAAATPFEFPELANSARMLETFGMSSEKWIPTIGNTAAATGKSIDQVTNALMDAQTGEFERLKELGIRTVEEGGQTYFQYMDKNGKLVKKAIDRNNPEIIESTLNGIWNDQYGGAMDKMSTTFTGKLSTLKDNINLMMQQMSLPLFNLAKAGLGMANTFFDEFGRLRAKGLSPLAAAFEAFKDTLSITFGESANGVRSALTSIVNTIGTVAGAITGALGAAFSFLADNMQLVIGAAKGLAVGLGVFLAFQAVTGILSAIGAALAVLTSPIFLVIAALAALGIAYQTNFLGFGDAVRKVASLVMDGLSKVTAFIGKFVSGFSKAWSSMGKIDNPIEKVLKSISAGLESVGLDTLADMFETVGDAVNRVSNIFQSFRNSGLSPLAAVFATLSSLFPGLSGGFAAIEGQISILLGVFNNLKDAALDLVQAFGNLLTGDVSGFFEELGNAAGNIGEALLGLGEAAINGTKMIVDAFLAVDWIGLGQDAINFIIDALSSPTAAGIFDWISDALQAGLQGMSVALQSGLQMAWDMISNLNWGDWINPLDWAQWLGAKIADFGVWLWGKISGFFPSTSVITNAIGNFATWIWGKISGFFPSASVITDAIGNFGTWIWGKIETYFPAAALITDAIGAFTTWIWGKIKTYFPAASLITDSIGAFTTWIWGKISSYFPSSSLITGSIADFGEWLYEKLGSPSISIPEFPGWDAFFDWINPWGADEGDSKPSDQGGEPVTPTAVPAAGEGSGTGVPYMPGTNILPGGGGAPGQIGVDPASAILLNIQNTRPKIAALLAGIQMDVAGAMTSIVSAFTTGFTQVQTVIAGAMSSSASAMTTGVLMIQTAAAGALSSVVSAFTTGFTQVQVVVAGAMSSTVSAFTTGMTQIQVVAAGAMSSTASAVRTGFTQIQTIVAGAMSSVSSAVRTGFTQVQTIVAGAMSSISSAVRTGFTQIQSTVAGAMSSVSSAVRTGFTQVQTTIAGAMSSASSAVRTGFTQIQTTVAGSMSSVVSAVRTGMSQATTAISSNAGRWSGILSSQAGSMRSAGLSVGQAAGAGVAQGMLNTLATVRAAANAIVAEANRAMRAAAEAKSPSRLTARLGADLTEGLAHGILKRQALAHLTGAASKAVGMAGEAMTPARDIRVGLQRDPYAGRKAGDPIPEGLIGRTLNLASGAIVINMQPLPGENNDDLLDKMVVRLQEALRGATN